ncbi:MAG: hypothetical protein IIC67_03770 [Thaumarchaeota archaeon]|nr:hypothetical protein [Nitrososphaerota archaeon]
MVSPLLVALIIEGAAFLYQKAYKQHPLTCKCSGCIAINVTIPITLALSLKTNTA